MRKFVFFVIFVLFSGNVMGAVTYIEGELEPNSFKVFQDGRRLRGDFDDDEFEIKPGTNIEVQVRWKNPYNVSLTNVETIGTLFDIGNDIERSEDIDIDSGDRGDTIVFEYFIPEDTSEGDYDFLLEVEYDVVNPNSTDYKDEYEFTFDIQREIIELEDILLNITQNLANEKSESADLLKSVLNLSDERTNCKSELGALKAETIDNEEYKDKYFAENIISGDYRNQVTQCQEQKKSMFSQSQLDETVARKVAVARREQKKDDDNLLLMIAGGAYAWYYFKKKKETVGGGGQGKPLTGTWK